MAIFLHPVVMNFLHTFCLVSFCCMHLCWFSSTKFTYVEPGFDDEPATSTKKPDQSYEERKEVQDIDQTRRHANWVKVQDPNTKHGSWRPRQKHRIKGKQWCRALDNQFRKSTGRGASSFSNTMLSSRFGKTRGIGQPYHYLMIAMKQLPFLFFCFCIHFTDPL